MRTKQILPVDIVLAPEWWNKHTGITFDRDFFFHPLKRIESEQKMEKVLYIENQLINFSMCFSINLNSVYSSL